MKIKTDVFHAEDSIIKGLVWYNGPLRKFFGPEPGSLVPLNLLAAVFVHSHSDVSMRILHGYTSIGLLPGLLVGFYLLKFVKKNLLVGLSLLLLILNFITFPINTWISVYGMNIPYGKQFHAFISVLLVVNFLATDWLRRHK